MRKLIGLELKKNNLKPYLCGGLGIFIFTFLTGVLFSALPILEPNNPSSLMFKDENMVVTMIGIVSMSAFAVLVSVMYAKFVVEEYTGNKNVLLFTYPQKRSHILLAKCILVSGFIFITMFVSTVIASFLVGFVGYIIGIIPRPFTNSVYILKISVIFGIVSNVIGVIALRVGFYKKSVTIPIVTAIALVSPFGNSGVLLGGKSIGVILVVAILLCCISCFLFLGLLKRVNSIECL